MSKLLLAAVAFAAVAFFSVHARAAQWCRWQISDGVNTRDVNGREKSWWGAGPKFTSDEVCKEYEQKFGQKLGSSAKARWICSEVSQQAHARFDVLIPASPKGQQAGDDPKRFFDRNAEAKLGALLGGGTFNWLAKVADNVPGKPPTPKKAFYEVTFHLPNGTSKTAGFLVDGAKPTSLDPPIHYDPPLALVTVASVGTSSVLCTKGVTVDQLTISGVPIARTGKSTSAGIIIALPNVDKGPVAINGRSIIVQVK